MLSTLAVGGAGASERRMTQPWLRRIALAGFIIGALFLAKGIYRATDYTRGDIYTTLPGEYATRWNPTLAASPDLQEAIEYNHGTYLYGPTQYLTLFPIVFLNSYHAIAAVLLPLYVGVLLAAWYVIWRLLAYGERAQLVVGGTIFAAMFAFLPLTQAMIQREFEVVAFLLFVGVCAFLVRGRDVASGATLAYLTWFKYWPVVLLGAFVMHRRVRAIAAFAVASVVILGVTQLVFGLERFGIDKTFGTITWVVRPLGSGEKLYAVIPEGVNKSDFCRQWIWGRGTEAEMRWALCGFEYKLPAFSAKAFYFGLIAVVGALFAASALRIEMTGRSVVRDKWAAIWECSILGIVGATFVHAHYYYYIVFVLPIAALAHWYATRTQRFRRLKIALLAVAYLLLTSFLIPPSWSTALLRRDTWGMYLDSGMYAIGTIVLLALVLWELAALAVDRPQPAAMAA